MRIRTKLQLAFILTSLLLAVSIMSVTYFYLEAHFEKDEGKRLKENVDRTGKAIDDFMFSRVTDFKVLSNSPLFNSSSNDEISLYFSSLIANYPFYESLFYVDKKGIILSSTNKKLIGANILELEPDLISEFNNSLNGKFDDVFISDISKVSQKEIAENSPLDLELLSNVIDENQNVIGVLVGAVCLDTLGDLIFKNDKHHFENEYSYLMSNTGVVLKSNNLNTAILVELPDFVKLKEKLKTTKNEYYIYDNFSNEKQILSFTKLSKYGTEGVGNWTLVSIVPYKEIMKPLYLIIYKTFFVLLITLIILTIFFYYYYKKKIQASIELAEKKEFSLNEVSKVAKIGYWDYNVETDTIIWSNQIYSIFDLNSKKGALKLTDTIKLFDEESQNKIKLATENLIKKGISYDLELKFINANKEDVWVRSIAQPIINEQNIIVGRRGIIQDITASKKASLENELSQKEIQNSLELLKNKEAALHEISSIAKIGYWEYSINNENAIWSDYHYEIFGLNPKDGIPPREKLFSFFDEESQEKIEKANLKLHTEGIAFDIEVKLINQKNKEVWVRNIVQPVYNKQNKVIGRRGLLQDITESKKAKQEIQKSLEQLENTKYSMSEASKVAKIGYWERNTINSSIIWSEYAYSIFGLNSKDGTPSEEELFKKFDSKSQEKLKQVTLDLNSKGTSYDVELKFINPKNEEVWLRSVAQPIKNEQNEIVGRRGVMQDITDTKKAQLELENSKQKIEESLELLEKRKYSMDEAGKIAKIGYWEVDTEKNISIWSDYVHYALGSNPEEGIPDISIVKKHLSKESFELFTKSTEEIATKGKPYDIEISFNNLQNQKVWIRIIGQPVFNNQNKIVGRRGLLQNITESKLAQQKIQESLNLLENSKYSMDEASKIAKIGYFEHDIATNAFKWSDYLYNIHGFDPKKPIPSKAEFIEHLDKESQEKLNNATSNLYTKGVSYDIEMKIFNEIKNKNIWVRSVAQPIYNDKNEIIGRRGVTQDITASKNAQIELENSKQQIEESLQLLEKSEYSKNEASKTAKIGYLEDDIATETYVWSEYIYYIFGFDPKQPAPLNKEIEALFDEESLKKLKKATLELDNFGVSYDIELRLINLRKEETWIRLVVQPIYNDQNKIVTRRGVLHDITDKKNNEIKLRENEEKFFSIFKFSPNLIILTRIKDFKIIDVNDAALKVTGYSSKDLIEDVNSPTHIWKSLDNRKKYFNRLIEKGQIKNLETEFVIKSGETRIWKISAEIIQINNIEYALSIIEDVTEIRKTEYELNKQSEFILAMTENQPAGIVACNSEGKLVLFNKTAQEWHGINVMEIPQDKWAENYGLYKLDAETLLTIDEVPLLQAFNGEKVVNLEIVIKAKNQNPRTIICNGTSFSDSDGNILGAVIVMNDVTSQKIVEDNLKNSESEIREALKEIKRSEFLLNESGRLAKVGAWELKLPSQQIRWSKQVFNIHGLPVGEVPSLEECLTYYVDGSDVLLAKAIEESIAEKKNFNLILRFQNKQKEKLWVLAVGYPISNNNGKITSIIGIFQDITEQKLKQIKLDEQNEKLNEFNTALNQAQKLSHVGSWHWDMAKDHAEWTDEMYNIYGVTRENFYPSNENVSKTVLPEDLYKLEKGVKSLLVDKMFVPFEFRIMRPSGEIRNLYIVALEKNSEEIVFGVTKDITEQKQIEEKNARITEEYKVLFDNATISIWNEDFTEVFKQLEEFKKRGIKSIKKHLKQHPEVLFSIIEKIKVNSVNNATLKLFKAKNAEEFITKIDATFGEGADKVFRNFMNAIWQNQKTFVSEINYKKLNGEEFAAIVSIPIPQTVIGQKSIPISIQSIQSIKEANKERNESIITLNEAQKLAHIGNWTYNLTTEKLICSDEMFNIWDFNQIEGVPEFDIWIKRIHKDDKKKYLTILTEAIELGTAFDIEHRICMPNLKVKKVRAICQPIIGANGKVESLRGTNQDVTEYNRIKDEIVKAQELYRVLADNSNDLICLHEIDSTFRYISPSIKTLLGYEQSELIGKLGFDLIYKDDLAFFRKSIEQRVSKEAVNSTFYCRAVHKDGHLPWFEFSASMVFVDGKINYILTSARDITEWMIAKQEIQDYQSSLQRLTTELTMVEEKQKKAIASNIHDHLSQSLVISKMRINVLKKNPVLSIINEDLKFIETHISDALENSRKITYELSPPALYQLGLIDALSLLMEDIEEKHKIMCSFNTNVGHIKLSELKSILIYRSIQELITNTLKYAAATLITIDIYKNNLGVNILITDNGAGFDTSDLNKLFKKGSGLGLFAVQERIRNIQGKFSIVAKINKGTKVTIFIPITDE